MKEWWQNLSPREQKLLILTGAFFIVAVLYFFIWSPISDSLTNLQNNVAQEKDLVAWMKTAVPQLQSAATIQTSQAIVSADKLFTTVENSLTTSNLKNDLANIKQNQDGTVTLSFNKIAFDQLINYLVKIEQQYSIVITTFSATRLSANGLVKCEVVLQHS